MCVFNAEKYIKESIESILSQTYNDLEFIILDDYSTDNTFNIIKEFEKKDDRIKIIKNNQNKGLTYSLNKAMEFAKGEYIARMDADDISHGERLKKQVSFLDNNDEIIVLGTCGRNIDEAGIDMGSRKVPITPGEIQKVLRVVNPMIHPSVMFRKDAIKDIGGYNVNYRVVQDYELWFRCIENGFELANLPDELIYYRVNNKYLERKSFNYRLIDAKIRYNGYKKIKLPIYKRFGVLIPLILGIMPPSILKRLYKYFKRLDPR